MNIGISLKLETLRVLSIAIEDIYNTRPTVNRMEKVYRSIGFDLAKMIESKYKAAKRKYSNLFDNDKEIKITLKFHEAWALIEILRELVPATVNEYDKNHLQQIIADLDEKTV